MSIELIIACPGADKEHPHCLKIIDESTGNLFCMASFNEWTCPFLYKDKHKMDYWKHGYDPVKRRWIK